VVEIIIVHFKSIYDGVERLFRHCSLLSKQLLWMGFVLSMVMLKEIVNIKESLSILKIGKENRAGFDQALVAGCMDQKKTRIRFSFVSASLPELL
jgi:hypothetical protein